MVERVGIDEDAVGREAGVVPVVDVGALHLVAPAISAFAPAARLDIATVGQQLVADVIVVGDPEADIRV